MGAHMRWDPSSAETPVLCMEGELFEFWIL